MSGKLFRRTDERRARARWKAFDHHSDGLLRGGCWTDRLGTVGSRNQVGSTGCRLDVGNIPGPALLSASAEVQFAHPRPGKQVPQTGLGVGRLQQFGPHTPVIVDGLPATFNDCVGRQVLGHRRHCARLRRSADDRSRTAGPTGSRAHGFAAIGSSTFQALRETGGLDTADVDRGDVGGGGRRAGCAVAASCQRLSMRGWWPAWRRWPSGRLAAPGRRLVCRLPRPRPRAGPGSGRGSQWRCRRCGPGPGPSWNGMERGNGWAGGADPRGRRGLIRNVVFPSAEGGRHGEPAIAWWCCQGGTAARGAVARGAGGRDVVDRTNSAAPGLRQRCEQRRGGARQPHHAVRPAGHQRLAAVGLVGPVRAAVSSPVQSCQQPSSPGLSVRSPRGTGMERLCGVRKAMGGVA
jgi:hypothetical protein